VVGLEVTQAFIARDDKLGPCREGTGKHLIVTVLFDLMRRAFESL